MLELVRDLARLVTAGHTLFIHCYGAFLGTPKAGKGEGLECQGFGVCRGVRPQEEEALLNVFSPRLFFSSPPRSCLPTPGGHGRTGQIAIHLLSSLYGLGYEAARTAVINMHHGRPSCRRWRCDHIPEAASQFEQLQLLVPFTGRERHKAMLLLWEPSSLLRDDSEQAADGSSAGGAGATATSSS